MPRPSRSVSPLENGEPAHTRIHSALALLALSRTTTTIPTHPSLASAAPPSVPIRATPILTSPSLVSRAHAIPCHSNPYAAPPPHARPLLVCLTIRCQPDPDTPHLAAAMPSPNPVCVVVSCLAKPCQSRPHQPRAVLMDGPRIAYATAANFSRIETASDISAETSSSRSSPAATSLARVRAASADAISRSSAATARSRLVRNSATGR